MKRWLGLLLCLGAALVIQACTSTAPATGPATRLNEAASGASDGSHVLVTLPAAPPGILDQRTRELAEAYDLQTIAAWQIQALDQRCVVFASRSRPLPSLLRALRADPRVDIAQLLQRFETRTQDGSYRTLQHAADDLHLEAAHALALGRGVRVAIIDSGVDIGHPELRGQVELVRDFAQKRIGGRVPEGFTGDVHGTAVAGIVGAADDGQGILGVAPGARLLALKACWPEATGARGAVCDSYTLALALDFAIGAQAQVINLSLGGPPDPILEALVRAALAKGLVVVGAIGRQPGFPSGVAGVLGVRALIAGDEGVGGLERPDAPGLVAAPGDEVLSTVPGGSFDFFSGSSLAAAHVSGIVALALELRPRLGPEGVGELLRGTARNNPGHAFVDACAPLAALLARPTACAKP
jgi:subtilisin family serine protease